MRCMQDLSYNDHYDASFRIVKTILKYTLEWSDRALAVKSQDATKQSLEISSLRNGRMDGMVRPLVALFDELHSAFQFHAGSTYNIEQCFLRDVQRAG